MAKIKGAVTIDSVHCKGCGLCVVACPTQVLSLSKEVSLKGYSYSYMSSPDNCVGCSSCAFVCPDTCITVYRMRT